MKLEHVVKESFEFVKGNFVDYYLIISLVSGGGLIVTVLLALIGDPGIFGMVLSYELNIVMTIVILKFIDKGTAKPKEVISYFERWKDDLKTSLNRLFRYFATSFLVGIIVFLGVLLFIVPGVIFYYKYRFAPILSIDKEMDPMSAIRESSKLSKGNILKMFWIDILFLLINIGGLLCLFVGVFFTAPMTFAGLFIIYRRLVPYTENIDKLEVDIYSNTDQEKEDDEDPYEDIWGDSK